MAKQNIQITLGFTANTTQAKTALQDLERQLQHFTVALGKGDISKNFNNATQQVSKLTVALREATNIDTGKFDLSKFDQSLKRSGTNLKTLRDQLVATGPEGTRVFMSLAQSIVQAEIPTRRINAAISKMAKSLKDTARWQISSSVMHGFTGAIQTAYNYAKDLNQSLNDIRIVTGYSAEQMDKFAINANKAAKALSTTTNEYAKASLIYFQQGLSDKDVEKRTATTIKMANVTGEAAEDVSSYMTAIWNNFDKGTKSLDHYADVITALGAATASSSAEIANGLEKFGAVANTVELSYEYATAALATVTSQTRESADTVGTAFKTIFARLESLSLGDTLEDGTSLTKYSQALSTIGVNIKEANGELKSMDDIVDEVGTKWSTLSKDQQVALAQTVAGMRQYNNFIALMDNYDIFKQNVSIARDSTGTLDEQQKIYEESWKAAAERVQAALEKIYSSLLDDDFFIDLLNKLEKILGFFDKLIDSAGGLKGILFGLSTILLQTFAGKAARGLEDMIFNIKSFFGITKKNAIDFKKQVAQLVAGIENPTGETDSKAWAAEKQVMVDKIAAQLQLEDAQSKLTERQKAELEQQRNILGVVLDTVAAREKELEIAENKLSDAGIELIRGREDKDSSYDFANEEDQATLKRTIDVYSEQYGTDSREFADMIENQAKLYGVSTDKMWAYIDALEEQKEAQKKAGEATEKADEAMANFSDQVEKAKDNTDDNSKSMADVAVNATGALTGFVSAISMLGSAWDTLQDPDLSPWEKFSSVFLTIVTLIPVVVNSFKALKSVFSAHTLEIAKNTVVTIANTAAKGINIALDWIRSKSKKASANAIQAETNEINENTNATNANTAAQVANEVAERATQSGGSTGAVTTGGAATTTGAVTTGGAATTTSAATTGGAATTAGGAAGGMSVGAALGAIGFIAAGIAVIIAAVAISIKLYNKANEEAEKAEKSAEALRKEAEATKAAYQKTIETITTYKDASASLKELTKGTTEWKEKLQETNASARELIAQFGNELRGKYKIIDGEIVFDEGALEEVQELQYQRQATAQAGASAAEIHAINKRNEAQKTELSRDLSSNNDILPVLGNILAATAVGAGSGALIGAGIGSLGVGVSAAPGAGIGALIGAGAGLITGVAGAVAAGSSADSEEEVLDKMAKKYANNTAMFADEKEFKRIMSEELDINDTALVESLWKNREATEKLVSEMANEAEQIKLLRFQMAQDANAGNETIQNSQYSDIINSYIASENYEGAVANRKDAEMEVAKLWEGDNVDFWEAYVKEVMGGTYGEEQEGGYRLKSDDTGSVDGNVTLEKWDTESKSWVAMEDQIEEKDAEATLIDMRSTKVSEEEAAEIAQEAHSEVSNLMSYGVDLETAKKVVQDYALNDEWNLDLLSPAALEELKKDENAIKKYGKAIEDAGTSWENTLKKYSSSTSFVIQDLKGIKKAYADFSKEVLTGYLTTLEDVYKSGGFEAEKTLENTVAELLNTNADKADKIMAIVRSIDFSQGIEGIQQLVGELDDIGVVLNQDNIQKLNELFAGMTASVLERDLSSIREEISNISKIASNLTIGGVISDEDYDTLIKYNAALKQTFMMTADGYRFTGSSKELKDLQQSSNRERLETAVKQNKNAEFTASWANNSTLNGQVVNWTGLGQGLGSSAKIESDFLSGIIGNEEILNTLNLSSDYVQSIIDTLGDTTLSADSDEMKMARKNAQAIFSDIATVQSNSASGEYDNQQWYELYASGITDINQLNADYEAGLLGMGEKARQLYEDQFDYIIRLEKAMKKSAMEFSLNIISWELDQLANSAENAATAITKIAEANNFAESSFELSKQDVTDLVDGYGVEGASLDERIANLLNGDVNLNAEELKTIESYMTSSQNYIDSIYENDKQMGEQVLNYFVSVNKEYDKVAKSVEKVTNLTEHYRNTIDLIGTGMSGVDKAFMAQLSQTDYEANKTQTDAARQTYEGLKSDRDSLVAKYEAAKSTGDETSMAYWAEQIEAINEEVDKAYENMQSGLEAGLKAAADTFKLQMEGVVETFESSMSGAYKSLDRLSEAYSQQSTLNSQYLSDYEKIYKLSKLTRQIEGSMDNASTIKAKTTLTELQREITALQESGAELSEYDLEYLNKKYELKQAEIALEETQASNRTMRLTQDANGEWGYTYTANEDATAQAEQTYEDKLFAMQEYNAQQLEATGSLIIGIQQEFSNAMTQLYSDSTLTEEELNARAAEITAFYTERMQYASKEYDKITQNNLDLYTNDWSAYSAATGYKLDDTYEFDTVLNSVFGESGTAEGYFANFLEQVGVDREGNITEGGLVAGMATAYASYKASIDDILIASGTSLDNFKSDIKTTLYGENGDGGVVGEMNTTKTEFENYIKELWGLDADSLVEDSVFDKMLTAIDSWWGTTSSKLSEAKAGFENVRSAYNSFVADLGGDEKTDGEPADNPEDDQTEPSGTTSDGKADSKSGFYVDTEESWKSLGHPDVVDGAEFEALPASNTDGVTFWDEQGNKITSVHWKNIDNIPGHITSSKVFNGNTSHTPYVQVRYNSGSLSEDQKKKLKNNNVPVGQKIYTKVKYLNKHPGDTAWYDTGGYTGEWGPEGRLATLHQKEIVLNATDTENFLQAIDIVRELVRTIDLQTIQASLGLSLGGFSVPNNNQTLQQEVTIRAEFPSVTDRNEIEEAFNSLMTRTSQFITTNR